MEHLFRALFVLCSFLLFFLLRAAEFAGVWAVASVALRRGRPTEAESACCSKGEKHSSLYRLTPLPSFSPSAVSCLAFSIYRLVILSWVRGREGGAGGVGPNGVALLPMTP